MYRLFTLVALGSLCFTTSSYGSPVKRNVEDLYQEIQALKARMDNINVECQDKLTGYQEAAHRPIVYLDRHDVDCPRPYTLARFKLERERVGSLSNDDPVRFEYRCCKVVL